MVVGIAALVCTGLVIMLVILKFGRHSKFGLKGRKHRYLELFSCLEILITISFDVCNAINLNCLFDTIKISGSMIFYIL